MTKSISSYRTEEDSLGKLRIPKNALWGIQTQRAQENFAIGDAPFDMSIIHAFGYQKMAAAAANIHLKQIPQNLGAIIIRAAREIAEGKLDKHFPLSPWQTGSGTQTHMNVNEVIANRSAQIMGFPLGSKHPVHPNDHANRGQSTNDSFPTVMHICLVLRLTRMLIPSLESLMRILSRKSQEFHGSLSIGRTHLQDATPVRSGMIFATYADQVREVLKNLRLLRKKLHVLPQGGTAVGTGINAHAQFSDVFCKELTVLLPFHFTPLKNFSVAMASHDLCVDVSASLNTLATLCMKMGNDLRLLGSGPRCGLNELLLPETEPGSSIMPGKVNPTHIEALTQVSAHVMGLHTSISIANSHGNLQLNVFKPLILRNCMEAMLLMSQSINSFAMRCLQGISVNKTQVAQNLDKSLMLVTALTPLIGYDSAASLAKKAHRNGTSLKEEVLKTTSITETEFDTLTDPQKFMP
ncbi:MAG: class II fumarate hydratase [Alphaproteobacteria bacterium]|nr:MAG: class II fumarate hydratase [Alphaproteobacteria bacterium]